jgi:hypothetical protein
VFDAASKRQVDAGRIVTALRSIGLKGPLDETSEVDGALMERALKLVVPPSAPEPAPNAARVQPDLPNVEVDDRSPSLPSACSSSPAW